MAKGQVLQQKHDTCGNPIGGSNQNSILNTSFYELEFSGGEIMELEAAESVHSQCNLNSNEHLTKTIIQLSL